MKIRVTIVRTTKFTKDIEMTQEKFLGLQAKSDKEIIYSMLLKGLSVTEEISLEEFYAAEPI